MKTCLPVIILHFATILLCSSSAYGQKKIKPLDSALDANSDKWKVKLHKGMFGLSKPEFGPYATADLEKLDSPVFKRRTKDSSYSGAIISSEGWDWDFSKYETIEKAKAYRTIVVKDADTAELLFSIYRISKEKNLTVFGELMSKNDEDKNETLGYKTNISGIMATSYDTMRWRFLIEDSFNSAGETPPFDTKRVTQGYLINPNDSLFTEPVLFNAGSPGSKYFWQSQTGVFVNNAKGDHLAALKFGMQGDLSNPFLAWIRKDLEPAKQQAIASLFALLIIVKTY